MMYYKLLIVQILFAGAVICLPQTRTDTSDTDWSTTDSVQEISTDLSTNDDVQETSTDLPTTDNVQETSTDLSTTDNVQETSTDLPTTDNIQETSTDLSTTSTDEESRYESGSEYIKDKVVFTVYYETHCPFSVDFFVEQLRPAVLKLGSHLELNTVPYGIAETHESNGAYSISCHHGASECHGNKVHACVLNHVKNKTQAVLYNSCLMSSTYEYTNEDIRLCGVAEKVPILTIRNILRCVKGTEGIFLLKSHGEVTKLNRVHYVPHLNFDGSSIYEDNGRANLIETICGMLYPMPAECPPPENLNSYDGFSYFPDD